MRRVISTGPLECREIVFSVDAGSGERPRRGFYLAAICRDGETWRWASAEPATERWGSLQQRASRLGPDTVLRPGCHVPGQPLRRRASQPSSSAATASLLRSSISMWPLPRRPCSSSRRCSQATPAWRR